MIEAAARNDRLVGRWAIGCVGLILALGATSVTAPRPRLVWNASASAPIGLYAVGDAADLARGDIVIARLPDEFRMFAARRHYLPANVPLVKRVAAVPGDKVCAVGARIFVNGRLIGSSLARDGAGRVMPRWAGCVSLAEGRYFLLMAESGASFDGRYFGVSEASDIVGRARLLWRV